MSRRRNIALALVALAVPLLFAMVGFAARPRRPTPWLEAARVQSRCLLPRERMRYEHMVHLKALRDRVVRDGVRGGPPEGLSACQSCHARRAQFCDRCHAQAGVTPDCFACHAY